MATGATIGKWQLTMDGTAIEEVLSVGGVGQTNNLVDVTNFDSPEGTMEYIGGLADGSEVSIDCNYLSAAAQQTAFRGLVKSKGTASFVLTYDAAITFTFTGVAIGYTIVPSTSEQNRMEGTIKISGDITEGTVP